MRSRLRFLLRERDVRGEVDEQVLSVYRDHGVVPKGDRSDNFNKTPEDLGSYKLVLAGDVVVNKMKAWQGSIAVSQHRGIVSGDYLVCAVDGAVDTRYLHHLLRSRHMVDAYALRSKGIRPSQWRLYWEDLADIEVSIPPRCDQVAIADFLDRETARIDALIAAKRRMSAALGERVGSLIDGAVWGDNSVRTPTFSSVVRIAQGQVDPTQLPFREMPLVAPNHIESGTGRLDGVESAIDQGAISGKYLCEPGDVVYSKIRPELAKATIAPWRCLTSADMYPLRPGPDLLPGFLLLVLLSRRFTDWAVVESDRVAMPKINRDALGRLRIPLPTIGQQTRVVAEIAVQRRRSGEICASLTRQIDLLLEHRQALITAAVAGQLDIPGVAA